MDESTTGILAYEIRYHPELAWWDARYRVYMVGRHSKALLGGAMTKRGARRVIKGVIAREKAAETYIVVATVKP